MGEIRVRYMRSGNLRKQPSEVFCKTAVLRSFVKFIGKNLHWSSFINKLVSGAVNVLKKISTQVFSYEICDIFTNTVLKEYPR